MKQGVERRGAVEPMSSYAYGAMALRREEAHRNTSKTSEPPGLSTYVDGLAAIVPAEVLALHALAISVLSPPSKKSGENIATIINGADRPFLIFVFIVCIFASMALYALGHKRQTSKKFAAVDYLSMLIPAFAFVAWTMAQRATAWDAIYPGMPETWSFFIAALVATGLGIAAAGSANADDNKEPTPAPSSN
jgi:hypothetical protein